MIDVKQAVRVAAEYFTDLIPTKAEGLLLEEVELVERDGRECWSITFSTPLPAVGIANLMAGARKDYKVFTVDAETGQVKSMKIRQINAA